MDNDQIVRTRTFLQVDARRRSDV